MFKFVLQIMVLGLFSQLSIPVLNSAEVSTSIISHSYLLLSGKIDCNGDKKGTAYIDKCSVCVEGNTGKPANECKLVFVSSSTYDGNMDGLAGADSTCNALAEAANLPGNFKAWVSDSTGSPSTRFNKSTQPYVLTNGTKIADSWTDLIDGDIGNTISIDESGSPVLHNFVKTSTSYDGTLYDSQHCNNWSSNSSSLYSTVGETLFTDNWWTSTSGILVSCNQDTHYIYCFEQ